MLAEGFCGVMKLLSAITVATVKATVVKKPKTFWRRTSVECMLNRSKSAKALYGKLLGADMNRGVEERGGLLSALLWVWRC